MKKTTTKLLTALLTLCIVLTLMPMTAFADSETYAVKFYPGDHGTMTKNDQIPFVYYGIDDDVNKPYYYKLNVSETETLSFASSIINVLSPNPGYEFAYWTANAAVYQVGGDTAISAGTALSSDQIQNKITVKSDVTFTAHFKQISEYPDRSEITNATIEDVRFNYGAGEAPVASAFVTPVDYENTMWLMNAGSNLKTTNLLPHGILTMVRTALCQPSQNLKAAKNMCIPLCLNQKTDIPSAAKL